jgi:hypothetical protein
MTEVDDTPRSRPQSVGSLAAVLGDSPKERPRGLARMLEGS